MDKKNPYLKVYLGAAKKTWEAYCAQLGKKPGVAIKEAIQHQLKAIANDAPLNKGTFKQANEMPDNGIKSRIEVRLTPSEKKAVQTLAGLENCSPQIWIVNAIRAVLTHQPQCGTKEIEALGESNYQLLSIGRNLNQIAKQLNKGANSTYSVEKIEQLRKIIDKHTEQVSKALRASIERWSIK